MQTAFRRSAYFNKEAYMFIITFFCTLIGCGIWAVLAKQKMYASAQAYERKKKAGYHPNDAREVCEQYFRLQLRTFVKDNYPESVHYEIMDDDGLLFMKKALTVQVWNRDGSTLKHREQVGFIKNHKAGTMDSKFRYHCSSVPHPEDKADMTSDSKKTEEEPKPKEKKPEEKPDETKSWVADHIGDIQLKISKAVELNRDKIYYPIEFNGDIEKVESEFEKALGQDLEIVVTDGITYIVIDC